MDFKSSIELDEFTEIFIKNWPAIFEIVYKHCKIIYQDKRNIPCNYIPERGEVELDIAKAVLKDFGWKEARKIGRLLIDATE